MQPVHFIMMGSENTTSKAVTFGSLAFYFIPLALQAITQSITYPLVAAVAARGAGGTANIAGLAQSSILFFFIGSIGAGIFIAGMIFGKTAEGYRVHARISMYTGILLSAFQALICIPPVAHLVLGVIMGLPPDMEKAAYTTLLASIPLQFIFSQRTPYMTTLFLHRATGRAYAATLGRIIITIILAYIFCSAAVNLTGPFWAIVCQTVPIIFETFAIYIMSRPFVRNLPRAGRIPAFQEIISYAATFSLGQLFLSLSGYIIGSFAARAPNPETTLPVYYAVISLFNAVGFAATRISATVITFYDDFNGRKLLKRFAVTAGLILGLIPLIFIIPFLNRWYFIGVQQLPVRDIPLIVATSLSMIFIPLTIAMRAYCEGKAAHLKKPVAILSGQAIYVAMITVSSFIALSLGVAGNMIGAIALTFSNVVAGLIILFAVNLERKEEIEIPPEPSSSIPER
jgi:hypothetical protein